MDRHMDWLLSLAGSVRARFYDDSIEATIKTYLADLAREDSTIKVLYDTPLNGSAPIVIIAKDPTATFRLIVNRLQEDLSEDEKKKFRPLTIITKLAHREFILDVAGNPIVYGIRGPAIDSLSWAMICRHAYSIRNYFQYTDVETRAISPELLEAVAPEEISGGRSKRGAPKASNDSKASNDRESPKVRILGRLIEYIKGNSMFANALVYLNGLEDVDNHAMDLIYSDPRAKDAVVDYIKLMVQEIYSEYKFEINSHQSFSVPFDFRLRKLSCLIRHRKTNHTSYLVNLYNEATYNPIPSYRSMRTTGGKATCRLMAHPLVRLRFLYLDLFFLQTKASSDKAQSQFETALRVMVQGAISDLKKVPEHAPTWAGIYRDEGYAKNQENMRSNIPMPYETIFI